MPLKKAPYDIPDKKKIRVIIDTDCNCEADDHFAVCHAIMTPKFEIMAILAEHYGKDFSKTSVEGTEEKSYKEVHKLLKLMNLSGEIPVLEGCKAVLSNEREYVESEASRFIVQEAMKEDKRPLFIINQGAITNLASAYLMEPQIVGRITAIWIGGAPYPKGGREFNLCNDINAANVMMDSGIELWQVPSNVYSSMKVSFAMLYKQVYPYGKIGKYMYENVMRVNQIFVEHMATLMENDTSRSDAAKAAAFPGGESWQLGDSPGVGLLLTDHEGHYVMEGAPRFELTTGFYCLRPENKNKIRVYNYVDNTFILEDFFAKLQYYYDEKNEEEER